MRERPLKYNKLNFFQMKDLKDFFSEVNLPVYLFEFYLKNPYPTKEQLNQLSYKLKEKIDKIKYWFKYQRKRQVMKGAFKYEKKNSFNKEQSQILLKFFEINTNPSYQNYEHMSKILGCKTKNVQNWFIYQRKKASLKQIRNLPSKESLKSTIKYEEKTEVNQIIPIKEEFQTQLKTQAPIFENSLNNSTNTATAIDLSQTSFCPFPGVFLPLRPYNPFFFDMIRSCYQETIAKQQYMMRLMGINH